MAARLKISRGYFRKIFGQGGIPKNPLPPPIPVAWLQCNKKLILLILIILTFIALKNKRQIQT